MEENEVIIEVNKLLQKLTGSSVECLSLYHTCDFESLLSVLREAVSFVKSGQRDNYLDELARSFFLE